MKDNKLIAAILVFSLIVSLAACGNGTSSVQSEAVPEENSQVKTESIESIETIETNESQINSTETQNQQDTSVDIEENTVSQDTETADSDSHILVLYFSRTGEQYDVGVIEHGNTAIVADMITAATGADEFEIVPADDHYPDTYDELTDVAKEEQSENARPAYQGSLPDLSTYDTIFIGSPVWWGDWPMIMYSVFESNDFSGKTLIPFSTHEGSGLSGFDTKLAAACPAAEVLDGLAVYGSDAQNEQDRVEANVQEWLSELGYLNE